MHMTWSNMSWMHRVAEWPVWLIVFGILIFSVVASWAVTALERRWKPCPVSKENNELVGFTYAVFGLVYGVVLAFTIIVAWQRFADAERIAMQEAAILSELWRGVRAFPPEVAEVFQGNLLAYAHSVIEDEWPLMSAEGTAHPKTQALYEQIWERSFTLNPQTPVQEAYLSELLGDISELSVNRKLRILHSRAEISPILWMVLLVGAVPTIGYTLLFASRHDSVQVLVTSTVNLIVFLSLFVAMSLQYPFTGDVSISPDAFREILYSFELRSQGTGARN